MNQHEDSTKGCFTFLTACLNKEPKDHQYISLNLMEKSASPTLTAKVLSVVCEHLNNDTDFRFLKDVVITGIMDEIRDLIRNNAKSIVASVTDAEALREAVKEKEVQIQQLEQTVLELQALQRQMRGSDEDGSSLDVSFTTEENATKKNSKN